MFFIIKRIIELRLITPFYEYFIHQALHSTNSTTHKNHHIDYWNDKIEIEYWILPLITFFYYIENYHLLLGLIQYFILHTISHNAPELLPSSLKNHHEIHHNHRDWNLCVSSTFPDYIYGTLLKKDLKY